ncbi:MAG: hypothetical protein AAFW47_07190 [Pseudomonadota bacterium]
MTWQDYRQRINETDFSIAEFCRLAGVSESALYAGIKRQASPQKKVRRALDRVFDDIESGVVA